MVIGVLYSRPGERPGNHDEHLCCLCCTGLGIRGRHQNVIHENAPNSCQL